jgi:PIN domain nuclease of toxin-antitoxin system
MRLLLDTHVILWIATADPRLSAKVMALIADPDHEIFVSAVSAWEIAIKQQQKKLPAHIGLNDIVLQAGYHRLDLAFSTPRQLATLPLLHKDPFDRMLIAQSLEHDVPLVSADAQIARYNIPIIW